MTPKDFAKAALGAITADGVSDGGRGSDERGATNVRGSLLVVGVAAETPEGESAAVVAATAFADRPKIALAADVLLRAKSHRDKRLKD